MPPKNDKNKKPAAPVAASASDWECTECMQENTAADAVCVACETPRPAADVADAEDDSRYKGFVVGLVLSAEPVEGKDKLLELKVDIGAAAPLPVVTNAPNVSTGSRIIVATVGATVGDVTVKKAKVGGVTSEGIVCDPTMLGWVGGGAGNAALVPDSFAPGQRPPERRPRLDGK
eukprot:TRINITY_DN22459_c0_g1_i1.p1 TRINITY_DN22459_c0_g1~~TRINITY_DN22459_c0_g1_i1.p1  ORF type:complete len:175 (+),score=62.01 TRINITY_DN22459_c0_g1_i1:80-604(+)